MMKNSCSSTTTTTTKDDPSPPAAAATLHSAEVLLRGLLPSTLDVTAFPTRWQTLRRHLTALQTLLSRIDTHSHDHPLLTPLIPSLLRSLQRVEDLRALCLEPQLTCGKLLMQSDLDMAINWLSKHVADLQLIVYSGLLQQHACAIVLSLPDPKNADVEKVEFFVKDLFLRLRIGGQQFKRDALESLVHLLTRNDDYQENDIQNISSNIIGGKTKTTVANLVARKGDLGSLVRLIDGNCVIRELAVDAISLIVRFGGETARKRVFEEGTLGPLLRAVDSGSMVVKEKAAMVVESLTSDPDNAWAVSAYGGVGVLVKLCGSGSVAAKEFAVGALRNVSCIEDARISFVEEGGVQVLTDLISEGNSTEISEKAAHCVSILSTSGGDEIRWLLLREGCLEKLSKLFNKCGDDVSALEQVLRAIHSLSVSDESFKVLSSSATFALKLADLLQYSTNATLQHISASLLGKLPINEATKKAIGGGCMASLMKMMECTKPDGVQEVASRALSTLLTSKSNRKELVGDEKILTRLVQMLDPKNDTVSKKFPVAVVAAVMAGGSQSCRNKLVTAGACGHLQRLVELDVIGAKKALQRLSANRLTSMLTRTWA